MHTSKILLMLGIMGCALSINAAVPNRSAVVSAIATQQCGCNDTAQARVDTTATNPALQAMGVANVRIESTTP